MKLHILIITVFISFQSFAQGNFSQADKQYKRMRYAHAIEEYEKDLTFIKPTLQVYKRLANSYYKVADMKNAERVYKLYFQDTTGVAAKDHEAIFEYAQALAQNGHYDKAATWYEKYEKQNGHADERGKEIHLAYKENIHDFYKDSALYAVYRLDINSPQSDFSPAFYDKGIVFCSARQMETGIRHVHSWNNSPFLDLYYIDTAAVNERAYKTDKSPEQFEEKGYSYIRATKELHSDETYHTSNDSRTLGYHGHYFKGESDQFHSGDPVPFSNKINTKFHEGPATFGPEGKMIIFTRNNYNHGKAGKDDEKVNRLKLYISKKNDKGDWGKVTEFPYNDDNYSVGHPALSADGKTLYFASDMPGGHGGSDLYKSTYDNGKWSKPVNLGDKINTEGNELFPFVDKLDVLYFASNGHPGLGGLDLFKYEHDSLTHLNYPISSKKDDFGIMVWDNGRKGYLSSNRHFGGFDDDLYMFTANKVIFLEGKVYDKFTKAIIPNADVVLKDTLGKVLTSVKADSLGFYEMEIDFDKFYEVTGAYPKYFDSTETFNTEKVKTQIIKKDLYLWPEFSVRLDGIVSDRETNKPLQGVHVKLIDPKTKEVLFETTTPEDGTFEDKMKALRLNDTLVFDLHLSKEKYLAKTVSYSDVIKDSIVWLDHKMDLHMDQIKIGEDIAKIFKLNPIYYDLGKWDIRPDAAVELNKIVAIMEENPGIVIELGSHTDCRSSKAYNQQLSEKRANSAVEYIISKGIDENRIYGKGYGESKLINKCACEGSRKVPCTEEEHALNRRTEFLIVKDQETGGQE